MANSIPVSEQYGGEAMETLEDKIDRPAMQEMAPRAGVAAIVVLAVVAVSVGFVIYKRRQRRSLMQRLQDAMPEIDEIRASLKRPLQRAVKVL
jgi:membrane protein insertase Oxa1/YidC/SpoIIIJ